VCLSTRKDCEVPNSRRAHTPRPGETHTRAERKERTRQTLLDGALRLLATRSLDGLSLREVAREAHIVPTAFYRHFESMDDLGVALVEQSMRSLRQMIRDARRNPSADIIRGSVTILAKQVRAHEAHFRFLTRERYGGVIQVQRAIATELRLFTNELTIDLARMPALGKWSTDDLEMAADLMVAAMLSIVLALLEVDPHNPDDERDVISQAERQLRVIALGMASWRSA
jgi:AcrR family transcriptional regulator